MQLDVSTIANAIANLTGSSREEVEDRVRDFADASCSAEESLLMGFLSLAMMKSLNGAELRRSFTEEPGSHPHLDHLWNHVDKNLEALPVNEASNNLALEMFAK